MDEHILILDDEKEIADLVELYLRNEGYITHTFYRSADALACIADTALDLAILDIMLPGTDGLSICRTIREKYRYPVIMLTAKETEIDKITGLAVGADDYVTKPFRPLELVARVKAQLRRYNRYDAAPARRQEGLIEHSGLRIDTNTHECLLNETLDTHADGVFRFEDAVRAQGGRRQLRTAFPGDMGRRVFQQKQQHHCRAYQAFA
jgi:two-component system response regulator VanR